MAEPGQTLDYQGPAFRPESLEQVEIEGRFTVTGSQELEGRQLVELQDARLQGELEGAPASSHTYLVPADALP